MILNTMLMLYQEQSNDYIRLKQCHNDSQTKRKLYCVLKFYKIIYNGLGLEYHFNINQITRQKGKI
jgi:hypothetical protein